MDDYTELKRQFDEMCEKEHAKIVKPYKDEIAALRTRAEQAEAALRELYTYPGVRDLLAPNDSLGSIAQRVEDILK